MLVRLKDIRERNLVKDEIMNMESNLEIQEIRQNKSIELGITGDLNKIDVERLRKHRNVDNVIEIKEAFKRANRMYKNEDSIIKIGNKQIGGNKLSVIAGPCAVESREQLMTISKEIVKSGANFLRGGAFKPRTSPYSFQGMGEEGLKLLSEAKKATGMPIVTELMSADLLDLFIKHDVDVLQIGARNMQNFDLLKAVGKTNKPVMLKRGMASTIKEFLMAAEYIMAQGNENVILCERGIRTFEDYTRNTLDLSSILAIKKLSHLPIIIDPSHATGKWWMVKEMAKAAVVVGADGIMVEVHNKPEEAMSDGPQSLLPKKFDEMMRELEVIANISNKKMQG
ncbi:3-deoxy-7-phosphoheptulonate synthase [Clostridiaceae bacterium HSG29]|nr:3-deoxy-7-phosphoheptulonate synthase [Clostridiaceae bacterium HSG29]